MRVHSIMLDGIEAMPVTVEAADNGEGNRIDIVGLPDAAIRESRLRIQRAVQRVGVSSARRVLFNLAPAALRKEGSALDLPMASAYVAAVTRTPLVRAPRLLVAGEIALDGAALGMTGALAAAVLCRRLALEGLVLPRSAVAEAAVVEGVRLYGVDDLGEALAVLRGEGSVRPAIGRPPPPESARIGLDLVEVRGQETAKRALVVAAAGGHNLLMVGPPGSGKTMLARALPGILPPLELEAALEVAAVHSGAGHPRVASFYTPPFRAPHHTASRQALVGGGVYPRPGEVSLAHRGILFLDELPEFRRDALEVLRQPLEDRTVTIARAQTVRTYPADFVLLAAMNPCPCGYHGDRGARCTCSPRAVAAYRGRISGPLRDRIDIQLPVRRVELESLVDGRPGMGTVEAREAVLAARARQRARDEGGGRLNGRLPNRLLNRHVALPPALRRRLLDCLRSLGLSARAWVRVLRLARTIADLERSDAVEEAHVLEAVQYRSLDRGEG